jgi:exodeoxyribonuclease V gamma subunit
MLLETCADLEPLVDRLATRLRTPLADPMAQEIIVVPVADMASYLKRELSIRLGDPGKNNGVVANIDFIYPRELINATSEMPVGVSKSPWDATRLSWSIMSLIRKGSHFSLPKSFQSSPLSSARRVAELFDRYASHRPEMLRGWADGHKYDVAANATQDWQVDVFHALQHHLSNTPQSQRSVIDLDAFASSIQSESLPQRISVFGVQALSRAALDVVQALDRLIDVAVYYLYAPSHKLPTAVSMGTSRSEYLQTAIEHPLYSRWSAQVLEARALVDSVVASSDVVVQPALNRGSTLLHQFQMGVVKDEHSAQAFNEEQLTEVLRNGDGSIQIHACYGLHRQVEALRDALLHALNEDPTLRLRDVLVVCSDIAAAAPVLNSILDPDTTVGNNVPRLPINVMRGAVTRPDEVTQAFLEVLQLASGRCSASQLLDVASLPPVRRAFSLDDNSIELLERWTEQLGVQFGLNTEHRKKWAISESITNGTWQIALERLMMGVAIPAERDIVGPADVVPFDAIGTSELLVAGTLAEFLTRVEDLHTCLFEDGKEIPLSLATWNNILLAIISNFIDVAPSASDSLARLRRSIRQMYADASTEIDVDDACFSLRDLSLVTGDYITNSVSDFWSQFESITVTDFGGMNNIPFKVIAFVGADESAFAGSRADGDDVLSNDPRVGEPQYSLRGRENLMNLLMSARNNLIITCNGADLRNNNTTPLAVPVQELIEHLASLISTFGEFGNHRVLTQHGRHNFDLRTLEPGHVRDDLPFTFDDNARVVWQTLNSSTRDANKDEDDTVSMSLTSDTPKIRDIQQLLKIVSNPISYYYKDVLNVDIPEGPKKEENFNKEDNFGGDGILALTLSPLDYSAEGRRLLQLIANFDGPHVDGWLEQVINDWKSVRPLTGLLPPGKIGELVSAEIGEEVRKMIAALPSELQTLQGDEIDCAILLGESPAALRVADVVIVDGVAQFARARYKRFADSLLLELWIELAVLTLHLGGMPIVAHLVARGTKDRKGKEIDPEHKWIKMKGDNENERRANAQTAIEAFTRFATIASQTPVDFFPSASSKIAHKSIQDSFLKAKTALKQDMTYNSEIAWYLEGKSLEHLLSTSPRAEEHRLLGLPVSSPSASRMEMYADFVWGAYNATVDEHSTSSGSEQEGEEE